MHQVELRCAFMLMMLCIRFFQLHVVSSDLFLPCSWLKVGETCKHFVVAHLFSAAWNSILVNILCGWTITLPRISLWLFCVGLCFVEDCCGVRSPLPLWMFCVELSAASLGKCLLHMPTLWNTLMFAQVAPWFSVSQGPIRSFVLDSAKNPSDHCTGSLLTRRPFLEPAKTRGRPRSNLQRLEKTAALTRVVCLLSLVSFFFFRFLVLTVLSRMVIHMLLICVSTPVSKKEQMIIFK